MKRILRNKWLRLIALYLGIFLFLLLYDERLNPEIAPFIDLYADSAPIRENGFYYAVGFDAPAGSDPHATGIALVRAFEIALKKDPLLEEFGRKKYQPNPLRFAGDIPSYYGKNGVICLGYAKDSAGEIERLLAKNKLLLSRYHTLAAYPRYKETALNSIGFICADFSDIRPIHRLVLADMAVDVHRGKIASALARLADDTCFWRHLLAEGHDVTTKLGAISILKENYRFLSELIAFRLPVGDQLNFVESMLATLNPSELDMTLLKRREFGVKILQDRKTRIEGISGDIGKKGQGRFFSDFLFGLGYKPNANANFMFPLFRDAVSLGKFSAAQILQESKNWKSDGKVRLRCDFLYNPSGNLMNVFPGGYSKFEPFTHDHRVHDLDGLIRLVGLQLLGRQKRISPTGMAEFLSSTNSHYFNPYTDKPMKWDPDKQCLYFESYYRFYAEMKEIIELFPFGS